MALGGQVGSWPGAVVEWLSSGLGALVVATLRCGESPWRSLWELWGRCSGWGEGHGAESETRSQNWQAQGQTEPGQRALLGDLGVVTVPVVKGLALAGGSVPRLVWGPGVGLWGIPGAAIADPGA